MAGRMRATMVSVRAGGGQRVFHRVAGGRGAGGAADRPPPLQRERLPGQRPVPERGDVSVQVRADPADLRLGDAGVRAKGLDQVTGPCVDVPCRYASMMTTNSD